MTPGHFGVPGVSPEGWGMASIGHLAAGAALGALYSRGTGRNPRPAIIGFAALAVAPDLDLLAGLFGVLPNTPLAHRGITHSILFAVTLGIIGLLVARGGAGARFWSGGTVALALASHGLLDTMSQLGNGPMLLWPFSTQSYEFLWRPIPGVLNAAHYLTVQAIPTLVTETLIFLPLLVYALLAFFPRRERKSAVEDAVS